MTDNQSLPPTWPPQRELICFCSFRTLTLKYFKFSFIIWTFSESQVSELHTIHEHKLLFQSFSWWSRSIIQCWFLFFCVIEIKLVQFHCNCILHPFVLMHKFGYKKNHAEEELILVNLFFSGLKMSLGYLRIYLQGFDTFTDTAALKVIRCKASLPFCNVDWMYAALHSRKKWWMSLFKLCIYREMHIAI